jgi:hypothetical protein
MSTGILPMKELEFPALPFKLIIFLAIAAAVSVILAILGKCGKVGLNKVARNLLIALAVILVAAIAVIVEPLILYYIELYMRQGMAT